MPIQLKCELFLVTVPSLETRKAALTPDPPPLQLLRERIAFDAYESEKAQKAQLASAFAMSLTGSDIWMRPYRGFTPTEH